MSQVIEFKLPDIGEGVHEGEVVEWFVRVGDEINEDSPMVEVMTDKATVTIGAPCHAKIANVLVNVGQKAQVGQTLVVLSPLKEKSKAKTKAEEKKAEEKKPENRKNGGPAASAVGDIVSILPGTKFFSEDKGEAKDGAKDTQHDTHENPITKQGFEKDEFFQEKPLATPATRALAKELNVDLRRVRPSGDQGRVSADDVRRFAARKSTIEDDGTRQETRKPFVGIRRRIAERMKLATTHAAHFTFVEECDVSRLVDLRARLSPEAGRRGVELTYLPFIVKAVVQALKDHPQLNCALDEAKQEIVVKNYFHIGIATATNAGLMVPVVHNADTLRLVELGREIERLAKAAREGTIQAHELKDSTFTITSLGKQGGLLATPILNYPEVGILGVHRIQERPVVRDGKIEIGQVMNLSLSSDHRIVDGHIGAAFAYSIIDYLQNPEQIFYDSL